MTNAINRFYIFVSSRYQSWTDCKYDVDSDGNGIIQYYEFDEFIKNKAGALNFSQRDITQIFNSIDRRTSGNVNGTNINECGAWSLSEQENLNSNIDKYNRVLQIFTSQYNETSMQIAGLGTTEEDIIEKAFELFLGNGSISGVGENEPSPDDANIYLKQAVAVIAKEKVLQDLQREVNAALGQNSEYPGLENDEVLGRILNDFIESFTKDTNLHNFGTYDWHGTHNANIYTMIQGIVKNYMATALVSGSMQIMDDGTDVLAQYAYSGTTMNPLQIARLEHQYKANINLSDSDFEGYSGFVDLNKELAQYIVDKKQDWAGMSPSDFPTQMQNASNAKSEFLNKLKSVGNAIAIGNEGSNVHAGDTVEYPSADNGWRVTINSETGYNGMYTSMYNLLGLSALGTDAGNKLINLFESGTYKEIVQKAYKDITANPDVYGVDVNNKWQLSCAIKMYVATHAEEILRTLGITGKDLALALTQSALQSAAYLQGDGTNSYDMFNRDITRNAAVNLLNFLKTNYGSDTNIMQWLQDYGLDTVDKINNWSPTELKERLDSLYGKLQSYDFKGAGDNPPGGGDLSGVANPLGSGRSYKIYGNNDFSGHYTPENNDSQLWGNTQHCINSLLNQIVSGVMSSCDKYDEPRLKRAKQNTLNYYEALVKKMTTQNGTGFGNQEMSTGSFTYYYEDKYGVRQQGEDSVSYNSYTFEWHPTWTREAQVDGALIAAPACTSGVYLLEGQGAFNNLFAVAFDYDAVWEKFKEFYDMLG